MVLAAACTTGAGVRSSGAVATPATTVTTPVTTTPVTTTPVTTTTAPSTTDPTPTPNANAADGVGDALFPGLGNPGIDVQHYDIDLVVDKGHVEGTVALEMTFTDARDRFTLDAHGPDISNVDIDGVSTAFEQDGAELRITLPARSVPGATSRVTVAYSVDPRSGPSVVGIPNGWFTTSGGSYVLDEPDGANTWLPCNDHPSDKATYTFRIGVPAGTTAVANGALEGHTVDGGIDTWVWQETRPMTTYLIQLLTGNYEIVTDTGPHGLPLVHAVLREDRAAMQPYLDVTASQIAYFEDWFGPYPLDRYGVAISDSFGGLAMETQERSLFSREDFQTGSVELIQQVLLSHELAHQWFGDAVSPARWRDIWLNESFATYGQWMWLDHLGLLPLQKSAETALGQRQPGSSADPTVGDLFGFNSYDGGAVVLHALRSTIGDDAFFTLLQRWAHEGNGTSRTTEDFVALAEAVTGSDLGEFFATWLYADRPPDRFP